jgi:MYXO-CTERM domain-containing protein
VGGTIPTGAGGDLVGTGGVEGGGSGGSTDDPVGAGGSSGDGDGTEVQENQGSGCNCSLGGRTDTAGLAFLALAALAFLRLRRRQD